MSSACTAQQSGDGDGKSSQLQPSPPFTVPSSWHTCRLQRRQALPPVPRPGLVVWHTGHFLVKRKQSSRANAILFCLGLEFCFYFFFYRLVHNLEEEVQKCPGLFCSPSPALLVSLLRGWWKHSSTSLELACLRAVLPFTPGQFWYGLLDERQIIFIIA